SRWRSPVKREKMFRRVHPDSANLSHGRSPLSEISNDLILAQSMPPGAVHTNSSPFCSANASHGQWHEQVQPLRPYTQFLTVPSPTHAAETRPPTRPGRRLE